MSANEEQRVKDITGAVIREGAVKNILERDAQEGSGQIT